MYHKVIEAVVSLTLVALCLGTEGGNMDNEYLRFGRKSFDNFMRFGRAGHVQNEGSGNDPLDTFGNEADFQVLHSQESNPVLTIDSLNDHGDSDDDLQEFVPTADRRGRDPFLRFGRNVPYLRFGRNVPYLRFGRNAPYLRFGRNVPYLRFGRNVPYLRFGRNVSYLRFGRNVPYLRFGRNVPYLRFGKRNAPYLRFGRGSPSLTNQAMESLSSFENSREIQNQPDDDVTREIQNQPDDVTILTGMPALGDESYSTDRKKRSVDPHMQETLMHVKGCVVSTDSSDSETANLNLDQVKIRESRSNPYMRFGKKNSQQSSDNNNYNWDRELELYTQNRADKRKQEYMRFGRSNVES